VSAEGGKAAEVVFVTVQQGRSKRGQAGRILPGPNIRRRYLAVCLALMAGPVARAALTGRWAGTWSDTVRQGRIELTFTADGNVSGFFEDYLGLYRAGASGTYNFQVSGTYTHDPQDRRMTFTTEGTAGISGPWRYLAWGSATVTGDTLDGPRELNVAVHVDGMVHTLRGRSWTLHAQAPPLPPTDPTPPDDAVNITGFGGLTLEWQDGGLTNAFDVYLGTDPDLGPDERIAENTTSTSAWTGALTEHTTYYWRVDAINGTGRTAGPVWRFSTVALTQPETDVTALDFGFVSEQLNLAVWNQRAGPMTYRLDVQTGRAYFHVADPNNGLSTGPNDRHTHVVRLNRRAIPPGQRVIGQLVVQGDYATNGPVYVTLTATGTDVRADLDITDVYDVGDGADVFHASNQPLGEEWVLELINANETDGPNWTIRAVDFMGPHPFTDPTPDPNLLDETRCTWGSDILSPGDRRRFTAAAADAVRTAHVPVTVSRHVDHPILFDADAATTTVTVTPDRNLDALEIEIAFSIQLDNPFGTWITLGSVTQDANSCSAPSARVIHETGPGVDRMRWRLGPVGTLPITCTVGHRVTLDDRCLWIRAKPTVTVRAVPTGGASAVVWQEAAATVPGRGTARIRGDSAVNAYADPDTAEWVGVRLQRVLEHAALTDLTGDGMATLADLRVLAYHWLEPCDPNHPICEALDFNANGRVDLPDLAIMAAEWTIEAAPEPPGRADPIDNTGGDSAPDDADRGGWSCRPGSIPVAHATTIIRKRGRYSPTPGLADGIAIMRFPGCRLSDQPL